MESAFRDPELKIIETFGWDGHAFRRLDRHVNRMRSSAVALGFPWDEGRLAGALSATPGPGPARMRLTLDRTGHYALTSGVLMASPPVWTVTMADSRVCADDPRLSHKTTDRALYDKARAALAPGVDEMVFQNERGEIAEGTITTLFFDLGRGMCTPPLSSGCLPGCLRGELLDQGAVREAVLMAADLPRARLWVGNSLRGLIPARLGPQPST